MKFIIFYSILMVLIVFSISCHKETNTNENILHTNTTEHSGRFSGVLQLNPSSQNTILPPTVSSFDSPKVAARNTSAECDALVEVRLNFSYDNCDPQAMILNLAKRLVNG